LAEIILPCASTARPLLPLSAIWVVITPAGVSLWMREEKVASKRKSEKYKLPPIHTGPSYNPLRVPLAPAMAVAVKVPEGATPQAVPEELELLLEEELELLLELDELELLELELLLDEELELLLEELELDEDELLELEELLLELLDEPEIAPADTVSVTRSSLAPSSLRSILRV
jgi:hypothetical protein